MDTVGLEVVAAAAASLGSDCPFFLAGGWALVEGRGERVAPLSAPRGTAPGVVLVTPDIAVSTPAVFARYAAGIHPEGAATLASSRHLAGELQAGMTTARLMERAGILAVANDLVPATSDLVPALVPARRALARLLERPVGQSGSGPTLWVLSPSKADALGMPPLSAPPSPTTCSRSRATAAVRRGRRARRRARSHHRARPSPSRPVILTQRRRNAMSRTPVSTPQAPAALGPYTPGDHRRRLHFCSGQLGLDPATGDFAGPDVETQAERALTNLRNVLDAAGCTFADVVKTTIFLADMADFAAVNAVYGRFVSDPPPARSTVQVAALPKGGRVEIEATARLRS